jgi:hypothetical protein
MESPRKTSQRQAQKLLEKVNLRYEMEKAGYNLQVRVAHNRVRWRTIVGGLYSSQE